MNNIVPTLPSLEDGAMDRLLADWREDFGDGSQDATLCGLDRYLMPAADLRQFMPVFERVRDQLDAAEPGIRSGYELLLSLATALNDGAGAMPDAERVRLSSLITALSNYTLAVDRLQHLAGVFVWFAIRRMGCPQ